MFGHCKEIQVLTFRAFALLTEPLFLQVLAFNDLFNVSNGSQQRQHEVSCVINFPVLFIILKG